MPEPAAAGGRAPLPWQGRGERADWVILAAIAVSALLPLALLPLVPALLT
jgi:hypothetical protein